MGRSWLISAVLPERDRYKNMILHEKLYI